MKEHRYKETTLSEREFASLLREKPFVDYLNVFLNLPTFSQRVLYKFSENDFEFDPPLRRTQIRLDRRKLIQWLLSERIPLFLKADLYLEYTLCRQLLQTELRLCPSSHRADYDTNRAKRDSTFLRQMIGHVTGMRKFCLFLEGSAGENVLQFWLDAERLWNIPARSEDRRRNLFREIQAKYFSNGGMLELPENEKWRAFTDAISFEDISADDHSNVFHVRGVDVQGRLKSGSIYGNEKFIAKSAFSRMQNIMLEMIRSYWLPKYIIHCRRLASIGGLDLSKYPDVDKLDLLNISDPDVVELLKGLERKHEGQERVLLSDAELSREKAKMLKMKVMFPHFKEECSSFLGVFGAERETDPESQAVALIPPSGAHSQSEGTSSESDTEEMDSLGSWFFKSRLSTPLGHVGQGTSRPSGGVENPPRENVRRESGLSRTQRGPLKNLNAGSMRSSASVKTRQSCGTSSPRSSLASVPCASSKATSIKVSPSPQSPRFSKTMSKTSQLPAWREFEREAKLSNQKVFRWLKDTSNMPPRSAGTKVTSSLPQTVLKSGARSRPVTSEGRLGKSQHKLLAVRSKHDSPRTPTVRGLLQDRLATCQSRQFSESGDHINLDMYYIGVVCYRRNNAVFVAAIAADRLSGHPFERYLRRRKQRVALNYLHFWQDAQALLSTRPPELDNLGEFLKHRRAKILILKYLHPCGENRIDLGQTLNSRLTQLLPVDEGDDVLRHAQDVTCQVLRSQWRSFVTEDMNVFLKSLMSSKGRKRSPSPSSPQTAAEDFMITYDVKKAVQDTVKQSIQIERPRSRVQEEHAGLWEERMFWALGLAKHVSHLSEGELCLGGFTETFIEDDDYGSLKVTKPEVVRNKALRDYISPPKLDIEKIKVPHVEVVETVRKRDKKRPRPTQLTHQGLIAMYPFLKPITKNGVVIERPLEKPKQFTSILRDTNHLEFLKRYLQREGSEIPILFWIAVEDMKRTQSLQMKQIKVQEIVRKYFGKAMGKGAALCCDADIIKEIPNMEKVTPSMLITAQVCVAKSLEERWWGRYGETFPKELTDQNALMLLEEEDTAPRKWTKQKTKQRWFNFVRSISGFRRGYLHPRTADMFREYLRTEVVKDNERKPGSNQPTPHTNLTLRRIIKNRIVAVEKLPTDLNFLIEVDRYRMLVDSLMADAEDGNYDKRKEELIALKAKAIIECFIDSDIPPRLQINISNEVAETIMFNYKNKLIERGLFHDATLALFPTLVHLWKKFSSQGLVSLPYPLKTPREKRPSPHASKKIPDYLTMDQVKWKQIIGHTDDECMRILFSLAQGIRYIMPPSRDDLAAKRSAVESGLAQYTPLDIHPGDSESVHRRLMVVTGHEVEDAIEEKSPDTSKLLIRRRRCSFTPGVRRVSRTTESTHAIAEESEADSSGEDDHAAHLTTLIKMINPDAIELAQ